MTSGPMSWLITSTTYGSWLPGDERGFVGRVWDARPEDPPTESLRLSHDVVDTPYDRDMPGLKAASRALMKGDAIRLNSDQAIVVLKQILETAAYRWWHLHSVAVVANHFHLVITTPVMVRTDAMLRDFKSYAARRSNEKWGKPKSGTWWTSSGSRRNLPNDRAIQAANRYVWNQKGVPARWLNPAHGVIDEPSGGR